MARARRWRAAGDSRAELGTSEVRDRVFWMDHTHRRPYNIPVLTKLLTDLGYSVSSAGPKPYGLKDLYVVAMKGMSQQFIAPAFGPDPFAAPNRPLFRRVLGPLKRTLLLRN